MRADTNWQDPSGVNPQKLIHVSLQNTAPSLRASFDAAALLGHPDMAGLGLQDSYVADVELGTEIMNGEGLAWVESFDVDLTTAR